MGGRPHDQVSPRTPILLLLAACQAAYPETRQGPKTAIAACLYDSQLRPLISLALTGRKKVFEGAEEVRALTALEVHHGGSH